MARWGRELLTNSIGNLIAAGFLAVAGAGWVALVESAPRYMVALVALWTFVGVLVLVNQLRLTISFRPVQAVGGSQFLVGTLLDGQGIMRLPGVDHLILLTPEARRIYRAIQDKNDLQKIHSRFADMAQSQLQFCRHEIDDARHERPFSSSHDGQC
jgi:hypothetical protein